MRYRAKMDFVSTADNGERILIATGDKVFVQQLAEIQWEVFSFYTRKCVGIFNTTDELSQRFGPESEFQKTPRDNRFKDRNFGKFLLLFIILLPFIGMSQVNLVTWDWKAVRVDTDHFEFHLRAHMSKGWWIYAPNRQNDCPYSPTVIFEKSSAIEPIGKVEALEYLVTVNNEVTNEIQPAFCPIPKYTSNVIFMQLFKMPIDHHGVVKGQITFQAMSKYTIGSPTIADFELHVGAEPKPHIPKGGHGTIITTYPKGFFRKAWHRIKHPFGHSWISKQILP